MTESLIKRLSKVIPIAETIKDLHPEWDGKSNSPVLCPFDHGGKQDESPSLSINSFSGKWKCFGCGRCGKNLVGYICDRLYPHNFRMGLAKLYTKHIGPTRSAKGVSRYRKELQCRSRIIEKLARIRGWIPSTIKQLRLGWDKDKRRITIPIYLREGICIDIRRHDSIGAAPAISGRRVAVLAEPRSQSGRYFPITPNINPFGIEQEEIWCFEGEPDAILGWQEGFNCVTVTGGVGGWSAVAYEDFKCFEGKAVIICFDGDEAGHKGARNLGINLLSVGVTSLKSITVPEGNDLTDFLVNHTGTAEQLRQHADKHQYIIPPRNPPTATVTLEETGDAQYAGHLLETQVLINGKHSTPHVLPRRITFSCGGDPCPKCPCKNGKGEYFVDLHSPTVLDWLLCRSYEKQLKIELGVNNRCNIVVRIEEWQNMEAVTMIPALSSSRDADRNNWCTREGYYLGHGLASNQSYRMEVMPVSHPRNKESLLLIHKAESADDSITHFALLDNELQHLQKVFVGSPNTILREVANTYAQNYTRIYRRPTLHAAVDLAFHSPLQFTFAGTRLPKGALELLLLGDTRCGKGQVAEGISQTLDLGELVSGENTSLMGLAGGLTKGSHDSWQLTWGVIPLNHGRLVILDEFSSISREIIGKLSRIRSEGIAEIAKGGITSKTRANTRLIWIANPRDGRALSDFSSGVEAVKDLIGAQEDIARFDLAVAVRRGDVSIEYINNEEHAPFISKYSRTVLRQVVRWVWSRSEDQVKFTPEATNYILDQATFLSDKYSPSIPLIQGENARFKIAKLSASVAGRCFSTKDGTDLIIKVEHAKFAVAFLRKCYDSSAMGYGTYSRLEKQVVSLRNTIKLDLWLSRFKKGVRRTFIDGMLSTHSFRVSDIQDWTNQDATMAKKYAGILVQANAIRMKIPVGYVKRPSFIEYLRNYKGK